MEEEKKIKTLNIEENIWAVLQTIRIENRFKTMNDVIVLLLKKYNEE